MLKIAHISMDKEDHEEKQNSQLSGGQLAGIIVNLTFNFVWIFAFGYVGVYLSSLSSQLDGFIKATENLQSNIDSLDSDTAASSTTMKGECFGMSYG